MLEECESYIQKIHQCNLDLPGEVITAKLSRLETVVTRILEEAKKAPKRSRRPAEIYGLLYADNLEAARRLPFL